MGTDGDDRSIYLEERHDRILELLDERDAVTIADLSELFQVSSATVRKDIRTLERQGKLRRTHGGAIKMNPTAEPRFEVAEVSAQAEKAKIGRKAAEFVYDGDTILLQSGTTCRELVRALKGRRNLTIIVSDLSLALEAERVLPECDIIILGGLMRAGYHYTQGPETVRQLRSYRVPVAFLSCNAFSFEHGVTAHRLEQANWVQEILDMSDRHIMLIDSTKIGTDALCHAADLKDLDLFITDDGATAADRERFARMAPNLEVIYAS